MYIYNMYIYVHSVVPNQGISEGVLRTPEQHKSSGWSATNRLEQSKKIH